MKKSMLRLSVTWLSVACAAVLALSSCRNDHCDELMYAPTNILFYSEMDTSVAVDPAMMVLKGVGVDSVINCSKKSSVQIRLDNNNEQCMFACAVVTEHSISDTLFIGSPSRLVGNGLDREVYSYSVDEVTGVVSIDGDFSAIRLLRWAIDESTLFLARPEIDTLVFDYTNTVELVSAECGCLVSHTLKNVRYLHNGIGTVAVVDSSVTNLSDAKNVKIYLENY